MVVDVTKKELVSQLTKNVMSMLYKKKDGTERTVVATLIPDHLPEVTNPRKEQDHLVTVFDTDKKQWRTLIFDNIQKILS